jgi:fumarate hydratase class II
MPSRVETDSLGPVEVPEEAYWGAQTARALAHFGDDGRVPVPVIHALALIKKAAALTNQELGLLDGERAGLIVRAADEVLAGRLDDQFPLSVFQSGSGTQTNMNVNEVLGNRAAEIAGQQRGRKEPVHPNDHVNLGQSTNDVFPAAMHIAAAQRLHAELLPTVGHLSEVISSKAKQFERVVKIGRTHLMDATPLTVGQELSGWASLLARGLGRLLQAMDGLYDLPLGGTAVGTGLNTHPEFGERAISRIAELTGLPFRQHPNLFAALSSHDDLAFVSAALRGLAGSLHKIADDVRLLASGPRCGIGELRLPENEPGSSIMPGKVNPTQCEALTMAAAQVFGHDTTVAFAATRGYLQLNVYKPVLIANLLGAVRVLAGASHRFAEYCVTGLGPDQTRIKEHLNASLMLVTALVPRIGYDRAAEAAQAAHTQGLTLREACIKLGLLSGEEFDVAVRPEDMTRPGRSGSGAP